MHPAARTALCLLSIGIATTAQADCLAIAKKASTVAPDQMGPTYTSLVACDAKVAEERFDDFMRASKDVDTLVALSLAAIDGGVNAPVWAMLEKIPDIAVRDPVAREVGAECASHPAVVGFLQGAHANLRDRQFGMWREGFKGCASPELDAWLAQVVAKPPAVSYDEKYNVVSESLVKRKRAEALPVLQEAAIAAGGNGGPFTTILDAMNEAVRPETFGAQISDEDRAKLEKALVEVARKVSPELASQVADRLYQAGAESAAASLLPVVYADRTQGKGTLVYGVAAVESCDKEAVVHYAEVSEPGKRWSIVDDVQQTALAFKPRLKCTAEGPWPVLTSPQPLAKGGLEEWVAKIEADWTAQGLKVSLREEKAFALD